MKTKSRLIFLILSLIIHFNAKAQNEQSESAMEAATNFITAFNNFDWTTFQESFTEDATIFYPLWEHAKRVKGRKDIDAVWLTVFPEFNDSENTRTLQISPKDINIQTYQNTAIVTFHLGSGESSLSRRTLVMIMENGKWKIAHLHSSNLKKG
ncbi:YybH family protein [Aegicerativicinus sediminis]|uniref:YybH family protein n=1 Tax=Aegicerativicinus sediminis TaxID=2893202 RepID=UPI001E3ACBA6|nr:nuclear transport factor 2 family protein [Aegicerativicinus sediminis]